MLAGGLGGRLGCGRLSCGGLSALRRRLLLRRGLGLVLLGRSLGGRLLLRGRLGLGALRRRRLLLRRGLGLVLLGRGLCLGLASGLFARAVGGVGLRSLLRRGLSLLLALGGLLLLRRGLGLLLGGGLRPAPGFVAPPVRRIGLSALGRFGLDALLLARRGAGGLHLLLALGVVAGAGLGVGLGALGGFGLCALLVAGGGAGGLHLLLALDVVAGPAGRIGLGALGGKRLSLLLIAELALRGLLGGPAGRLGLGLLSREPLGLLLAAELGLGLGLSLSLSLSLGLGLLLLEPLLLRLLLLELLLLELLLLAGLGVALEALAAGARLELRPFAARRQGRGRDQRRGAARVGLPLRPLLLPQGLLLLRLALGPFVVFATPVGVALLFDGPLLLLRENRVAARAPLAGVGRLALLVQGGVVEAPRTEQVLGGDLRFRSRVVRIGPAVAVVDLDQFAVVVGVGIAAVANQERIVAVAAVEVLALAVRGPLHHPVFAAAGTPDVGPLAVVVDGVVGRAVGEGVAQLIGVVHIGVDRPLRARGPRQRRDRRQGVGVGGDHLGRRRGLGQRQAGDRRARGRGGGLLVARGERKARGGGGQEKAAV